MTKPMTENELNVKLCAVLSTLLSSPEHTAPETPIYMALGCNWDTYMLVRGILCNAGLCTGGAARGHTLTLTDKGVVMAKEVDAVIAAAK